MAEDLAVRETVFPVRDTKIAFAKCSYTLICPNVREGLYIEGLGPEYDRGLATGPAANYMWAYDKADPVVNGHLAKTRDEANHEFRRRSVPLGRMSNRLPYAEMCTLEAAEAEGYTVLDFFTHEPYSRNKALKALYDTTESHKTEAYYMDAIFLQYDAAFSILSSS